MKWLTLGLLTVAGAAFAERPPVPDEQKAQMEQRADESWNKLPAEAKVRLMRLHNALNQMPPEERRLIHERIERFLSLSPEEREQMHKNADRWRTMSPEERDKAREQFRIRRKEFEDKWRQEHPGEEPPPFPPHGRRPPPRPENPEPKPEPPPKETP